MIRRPTSFTAAYDWHRRAVAGLPVETHDGLPQCGWFKMRRIKGGPFVPVRIWIEREIDAAGDLTGPEVFRAEVEGLACDPVPIWTYLKAITRADYDALVEMHRTEDRMTATMVALDLSATPTLPPMRST